MKITKEQFDLAIFETMKRINNGLFLARQSNIICELPERVDFQVEVIYSANELERTSSELQAAATDIDAQTQSAATDSDSQTQAAATDTDAQTQSAVTDTDTAIQAAVTDTDTQAQLGATDTDSQVAPSRTRTTTHPTVTVQPIATIGTPEKVVTTRVYKEAVIGGGTIE